jgi:hypothetical protein
MERGSNLNVPEFWKGALSYYAVCNNNWQCIELWVQLGTILNNRGTENYESICNGCRNGRGIVFILIYFILIYVMI